MHRIVPRRGGSRFGAAALVLRLGRNVDHFPVLVIPMRPADRIARFVEKESEFRARAERMRPPWIIPLNAWMKCRSRLSCLHETGPTDRCRRPKDHRGVAGGCDAQPRSEEHTSELQSLMRISYAVFCLKQKNEQDMNRSPSDQTTQNNNI